MLRQALIALALAVGIFVGCSLAAVTRPELFLQTGHSSMITSVAYSPDGRTIATSSGDRSVRLWDAATGIEVKRFFGHTQMVLSVAFSPDGKQLLTGSLDKTARLWDVATGKELRRFECECLMIPTVAFSPDGKQVLTHGKRALWVGMAI